ncbi:hypothetical protein N0V85_009957, partial [Neurospora sp. IMI 360204]
YTDRLVNETQGVGQFDYIIHDVFTGGAEPVALFTYEFLQNLNSLLKPDGVVAIWEVTDEDLLRGVNGSVAEAEKLGVLRRNDTSMLEKWQEESALGHWEIMRVVLPEVVWVNW